MAGTVGRGEARREVCRRGGDGDVWKKGAEEKGDSEGIEGSVPRHPVTASPCSPAGPAAGCWEEGIISVECATNAVVCEIFD